MASTIRVSSRGCVNPPTINLNLKPMEKTQHVAGKGSLSHFSVAPTWRNNANITNKTRVTHSPHEVHNCTTGLHLPEKASLLCYHTNESSDRRGQQLCCLLSKVHWVHLCGTGSLSPFQHYMLESITAPASSACTFERQQMAS